MDFYSLEYLGDELTSGIKNQGWFPVGKDQQSGHLKNHATIGAMFTSNSYRIHFSSTVAPYVEYLEEGTKPHDIPHAFGYGTKRADKRNPYTHEFPFGVGGRFDGKFHPGSTKHKGFISNKSVNYIIDYICRKYDGEVVVL